ncbi:aldo/keto reductase [Phenylobacterium sp.]|uniref:aldo/keto reductase n=1 Tax=Phenylobacterium sp. TaxID=1871053 RepID=UPI002F429B2E
MTRQIALPWSSRLTSQLGYGCAFWPGMTEQQIARLLAAAYDAGIRHFDVAPFYLDGAAERFLGDFLKLRPDATVTTKYGLLPPSARPLHIQVARALLGPTVRRVRKMMRGRTTAPDSGGVTAKASFRSEDARQSLENSLRLLGRSHVEMFLMHEADASDLERDGLLDLLRSEVQAGRIGAFGIGGAAERARQVHLRKPEFCDVVQYDWDFVSDGPRINDAFEILFWVLTRDLKGLHGKFLRDAALATRWSDATGVDLTSLHDLSGVLLAGALSENPRGMTLVYSSNEEHILANVAAADSGRHQRAAIEFKKLLTADGPP